MPQWGKVLIQAVEVVHLQGGLRRCQENLSEETASRSVGGGDNMSTVGTVCMYMTAYWKLKRSCKLGPSVCNQRGPAYQRLGQECIMDLL